MLLLLSQWDITIRLTRNDSAKTMTTPSNVYTRNHQWVDFCHARLYYVSKEQHCSITPFSAVMIFFAFFRFRRERLFVNLWSRCLLSQYFMKDERKIDFSSKCHVWTVNNSNSAAVIINLFLYILCKLHTKLFLIILSIPGQKTHFLTEHT